MELPEEVLVHNTALGLKGSRGQLVRIHAEGYYEVILRFGDNNHRACLPIPETALIVREPEEPIAADSEIER